VNDLLKYIVKENNIFTHYKDSIAMKRYYKNKEIDSKTEIVTADIGKINHYGYIRSAAKDLKTFRFSNDKEGFDLLWSKVEKFKKSNNLEDIVFGFESTGSYGEPLKLYMQQKGVILIQVNPMHTKRLKELSDNSPNKTDKKDPRVIADILMLGHGLTTIIPEKKIADLRELAQSRESRLEDINRVKNRIEALLAKHFPEFLLIMGLNTKTSMYLLKHYPTARAIGKQRINKLAWKVYKVSRSQIKYSKVVKLDQAAINSVGVKEGQHAYRAEIRRQLEQVELLEHQLGEIEKQITAVVEQMPEGRILRSVKGIGVITAAYLLSEVVDFKAYSVQKEIEKLAGLNLYEISSGKHKGQRRISKRGRALIRKVLYMVVLNMVKKSGIYYEDYQSYLKRGLKKIEALVIIMKRLLRTVYALVRKNEMFKEGYKIAA